MYIFTDSVLLSLQFYLCLDLYQASGHRTVGDDRAHTPAGTLDQVLHSGMLWRNHSYSQYPEKSEEISDNQCFLYPPQNEV